MSIMNSTKNSTSGSQFQGLRDEVVLIDHLSVNEFKFNETLGVCTCPSGNYAMAIKAMHDKAQDWLDTATNGKLYQRQLWFMLEKHLLPRVGYSISSNTHPHSRH